MLHRTCFAQVLRNPSPKMTTMRPVGEGANQVWRRSPTAQVLVSEMKSFVFFFFFIFFVDKMSTHQT